MPVQPPPNVWDLPDPASAAPGEDIVGIGADLQPGTVLAGYARGLFPMHIDDGRTLAWWSPDPRGVLPLDHLRVSRSLRKSCRRYTVTVDQAFTEVMRRCADPRRDSGWITEEFVETYSTLHELGWTHSVEVWNATGDLVGGLYGVEIGGLFAGESMFHAERDASKVALVALVERLRVNQASQRLLDVQWATEHLMSLGAVEISRREYLRRLTVALDLQPVFV